ncbi:DoxX family protein [Zhihengliuella halotolerans]|uniref:Putative membrane protein YphA (DoxX/SURF4 family) n=1 Tax=Zhihengliuella halotolerans TaxID=370736 RepID=A0A4Q8ABY8_9MICC|nr:DoxX family protein [Zhihengliuella halotolerans]RZU61700.1 putative membrane protein YphA (DoxX/SURF4 family) [Zhihengliuella halotolerans]
MSAVRLIARPLLASSYVWTGVERLTKPRQTADRLRRTLDRIAEKFPQAAVVAERPELIARAIGGTQVAAGVLFAVGKAPRFSAATLVLSSLVAAADDYADSTLGEKLKSASLAGGVLLASVDTAGQPSLAWRAQHLSREARKQLARTNKDVTRAVKRTAEDAAKSAEGVLGR